MFSLVTEAAQNAVHSGNASRVEVGIHRQPDHVLIDILSDGEPWDPLAPPKPYSAYGIRARLQLAHHRMSAEYEWGREGRQLTISIPILPAVEGVDPYVG